MEITLKEITKIFSQKNNIFFGGKYTWPSGAIIYHFQKQAVTGKEIDEEFLEYCEDFIVKSSFKDLSKLYRAVYLLLHEKLSDKVFSKSKQYRLLGLLDNYIEILSKKSNDPEYLKMEALNFVLAFFPEKMEFSKFEYMGMEMEEGSYFEDFNYEHDDEHDGEDLVDEALEEADSEGFFW